MYAFLCKLARNTPIIYTETFYKGRKLRHLTTSKKKCTQKFGTYCDFAYLCPRKTDTIGSDSNIYNIRFNLKLEIMKYP